MPLSIARRAAILLVIVLATAPLACGGSGDYGTSDTARWLRLAGRFDETPAEIACVERAMDELLTAEELHEWLSHDPAGITVEEVQVLPHAIEIADRCR